MEYKKNICHSRSSVKSPTGHKSVSRDTKYTQRSKVLSMLLQGSDVFYSEVFPLGVPHRPNTRVHRVQVSDTVIDIIINWIPEITRSV